MRVVGAGYVRSLVYSTPTNKTYDNTNIKNRPLHHSCDVDMGTISMSGFNLPPGCRLSDIPGNRPEDLIAEAQADAIYNIFPDATDEQLEKIVKLLNKAFEDGYQECTSNAQEAAHWDEVAKELEAQGDIEIHE